MPDEIDLSILTSDERHTLAWKRSLVAERDERVLPGQMRGLGYPWEGIAWAVVIGVGSMILSATALEGSDPLEGWAWNVGVFALITAALFVVMGLVAKARQKRAFAAVVPDYLTSIKYVERVARGRRSGGGHGSDDGPVYYTNGYEPDRWLHGYSKSDRDYMRMTGMDADIYDSNVLENDKD